MGLGLIYFTLQNGTREANVSAIICYTLFFLIDIQLIVILFENILKNVCNNQINVLSLLHKKSEK